MSRLSVMTGAKMRTAGETIRGQFVQRIAATPPGVCAVAEGVELITLKAPLRIEADADNAVCGLWVQPQIIGAVKNGRPAPKDANKPEEKIDCDIILVAIGQDIVSQPFAEYGIPVKRGRIQADRTGSISNVDGIFAGGECVSGPATVIRAIEGGKVAAANIDEYLGFRHPITCDVEIPEPLLNDKSPCGRANLREREEEEFDQPLGVGSGAGVIFGATGGVMEAALRTAYALLEGHNPDPDAFAFIRGQDGIRKAELEMGGIKVRAAIVSGLGNARKLIENIRAGKEEYDFVEVMACPGGCVGGGGQPIHDGQELAAERAQSLYCLDRENTLRFSHENPAVVAAYERYFGKPLSHKAHALLHTDHDAWKMPNEL